MIFKKPDYTPESHLNHTPNKQHSERLGNTSSDLYTILNKENLNRKNRFILILLILKTSIISKISRQKATKINTTDTNEEHIDDKFSLHHLDDILETSTEDEGLLYLQKFLKEIGSGFSRKVFQYGDNQVIKYDLNPKNYKPSQNTVELDCFTKLNSPILPNIYSSGKDNIYLICEQAKQIQLGDFQKILHIPFGDDKIDIIGNIGTSKSVYPNNITVKMFISIMEKIYSSQKPKNDSWLSLKHLGLSLDELVRYNERKETLENVSNTEIELYKDLAINHPRFKELARYIKYVISTYDVDYCDLNINNFGVVTINGELFICILDSGRSGPI